MVTESVKTVSKGAIVERATVVNATVAAAGGSAWTILCLIHSLKYKEEGDTMTGCHSE